MERRQGLVLAWSQSPSEPQLGSDAIACYAQFLQPSSLA